MTARPLPGAVVVITGASSGIGRAAARRFAERGARLALGAREPAALEAAAAECADRGAEVVTAVCDVADEDAVRALARAAEARFGGIDVWVNNAGVMAYGRFEQMPSETFRGVIETNLLGQVHGARAALAAFRRGGGGVLINVSSTWGRIVSPDVGAYVVSKHGVRALSEVLQHELRDTPEIAVCAVYPQAVDTPIFDTAANHSGRRIRGIPPMFDPDVVARGIVACAQRPRRRMSFGVGGRMLVLAYTLAGPLWRRLAPPLFDRLLFGEQAAEPTRGNVLAPAPADVHRIEAGWRGPRRRVLWRAALDGARGAVDGARRR